MTSSTDTAPRLIAVLGPTNTGKTHLAVERMLGHTSGIIGLPLRLLAREVYDRVVERAGRGAVALVTGEEKLVPANPRYFVCTVEAMPLDHQTAFVAIDEIQLCADAERGHVFTHRLLHARGREETMLLGAETIRPLIRRLAPDASFVTRPRLSKLSYAGAAKLTRLPPRSAVVAFSAADVYAIAEYLRRQRGGTAVVLGALSPRTRNAQVALYQAGEVDYMVATDAIGMGLNLDVDHIAFASLRKFDGRVERALSAAEVAQIAGRAGRHMNDGSFGTASNVGPLDPAIVEAVENHRFPKLRHINWRNGRLRFESLKALLRSLDEAPPARELSRAPDADDHLSLAALARDDAVTRVATNPDAVRLLWDVCQTPDYRKVMADAHVRMLGQIYHHLMHGDERLPTDWIGRLVDRLDRTDGDIDTLSARIAHVRTWTYVSNRTGWLADPAYWQGRTRAVEDRLSDALHERLTQRFIDRRTAALSRRMKHDGPIHAVVGDDGDVAVESHFIGRLVGFRFAADAASAPEESKALWHAAKRALRSEIARRAVALAGDPDDAFTIDDAMRVLWRGAPVARLVAAKDVLRPRVEPLTSELLEAPARDKIRQRLDAWLVARLAADIGPLTALREAALEGAARGVAYQVSEALGALPRRAVEQQLRALTPADRKALGRLGLRIGSEAVYLAPMIEPHAIAARALLWTVNGKRPAVPAAPARNAFSLAVDTKLPVGFYAALGYRVVGGCAFRVDVVERIAAKARKLARLGPFTPGADLASLARCNPADVGALLASIGYRAEPPDAGGLVCYVWPDKPRSKRASGKPARRRGGDAASPFAKLAELGLGE